MSTRKNRLTQKQWEALQYAAQGRDIPDAFLDRTVASLIERNLLVARVVKVPKTNQETFQFAPSHVTTWRLTATGYSLYEARANKNHAAILESLTTKHANLLNEARKHTVSE